jgi:hypothetical protein
VEDVDLRRQEAKLGHSFSRYPLGKGKPVEWYARSLEGTAADVAAILCHGYLDLELVWRKAKREVADVGSATSSR